MPFISSGGLGSISLGSDAPYSAPDSILIFVSIGVGPICRRFDLRVFGFGDFSFCHLDRGGSGFYRFSHGLTRFRIFGFEDF